MKAEIIKKISSYNKNLDKDKISRAFEFVLKRYDDIEANTNDLNRVLDLLFPLKPDQDTIIAVFLHDLYLLGFINDDNIKEMFGNSVLNLLLSLKKLSSLNYAENDKSSQVEILRKMYLTMAKDLRVILIWLAFRLSKMNCLDVVIDDIDLRTRFAKETMELYVPIASRLGVYRMKTQLEDLSFKYLNPEEYKYVSEQVDKFGKSRKLFIESISNKVDNLLKRKGLDVNVHGRFKNIYSIYKKMKRKNLNVVDDLFDLFAIRVIISSNEDEDNEDLVDRLYAVLGIIHSEWRPISSRFKDYIAVPKPNGYRSLHTVVLGLAPKDMDQPVEVQIRDSIMHREAEYGMASHWVYKSNISDDKVGSQSHWIKGFEKIHQFFDNELSTIKEVELDVFKDRIFVLTPRGEVKDLPLGSIPIDFAYAVHTEVGHQCVMAKVNGSLVPLDYELKNGDVVDIITKKNNEPKLRWLSIVKSNFGRNKIKAWFNNLNKENNLKEGKTLVNSQLERIGQPLLDQNYTILKEYCGKSLNVSEREHLLEEVGKGSQLASDVIRKVYPYEKNLSSSSKPVVYDPALLENQNVENLLKNIVVGGEEGLPLKIANCCSPRLGNKIIAFVTRGNRITIHKSDCNLLHSLDFQRIIPAHWKGFEESFAGCRVGIKVVSEFRVGFIKDISAVIASMNINIIDILIKPNCTYLLLDLLSFDQFDYLLDKIEQVKGVLRVSKVDSFR